MRWVDKFENDGEIKRHNRKPIAYKVHKNEVKFILEQIKINKTITMEDLLEKIVTEKKIQNIFMCKNDEYKIFDNIDYNLINELDLSEKNDNETCLFFVEGEGNECD